MARCPRLLVLPFLLAVASTAARGAADVRLSSWDVLTLPGATVTVAAKLEKRGVFRKDIEGRTVEFVLLGDSHASEISLGQAVTDDEGEASITWTAATRGEYRIEARFRGDRRYRAGTNVSLVSVRAPDRPVAIFDIDHTLQQTSVIGVARGNTDDLPLPGAPQAVATLAEHFDIVYVSARMTRYLSVSKRWLDRWGFPRNPLFLLDKKLYPEYDEAKYKTDAMKAIRESFPNLAFGVGDKESDAQAYRALGIRSFILEDTGGVEGAEKVDDWAEVVRRVLGDRATRFGHLHARSVDDD